MQMTVAPLRRIATPHSLHPDMFCIQEELVSHMKEIVHMLHILFPMVMEFQEVHGNEATKVPLSNITAVKYV